MNVTGSLFKPKDLAPLGKVGHGVTIYGYDTINSQILICLGWGSSFADHWIPINNFSDRIGLYVTSWNKSSHTEAELLSLTEPAFADTPFTSL